MLVANPHRKPFRMRMGEDGSLFVVDDDGVLSLEGGRSFACRHCVVSCLRTSLVE